ncbi:protein kinase [Thiotrichales bacterium 19S3-7]|nr:protein kinase [Thiotrichales bacterium 19S3-7]MCF6801090.1 protein kinase [Thiotrichales bacterium 19S3-11]
MYIDETLNTQFAYAEEYFFHQVKSHKLSRQSIKNRMNKRFRKNTTTINYSFIKVSYNSNATILCISHESLSSIGHNKVKIAYDNKENIYALKIIKKNSIMNVNSIFDNELNTMLDLGLGIGGLKRKKKLYLAYYYLGSPLRSTINKILDDHDKQIELAIQIAIEVYELHTKGYTHGDIKPENIVIDKNGEVHLIDFSSAKDINSNTLFNPQLPRTKLYLPKDYLSLSESKADIFALLRTIYLPKIIHNYNNNEFTTRNDENERLKEEAVTWILNDEHIINNKILNDLFNTSKGLSKNIQVGDIVVYLILYRYEMLTEDNQSILFKNRNLQKDIISSYKNRTFNYDKFHYLVEENPPDIQFISSLKSICQSVMTELVLPDNQSDQDLMSSLYSLQALVWDVEEASKLIEILETFSNNTTNNNLKQLFENERENLLSTFQQPTQPFYDNSCKHQSLRDSTPKLAS